PYSQRIINETRNKTGPIQRSFQAAAGGAGGTLDSAHCAASGGGAYRRAPTREKKRGAEPHRPRRPGHFPARGARRNLRRL
nr:hypothetical protein [Tanacetum cinerariifolium]